MENTKQQKLNQLYDEIARFNNFEKILENFITSFVEDFNRRPREDEIMRYMMRLSENIIEIQSQIDNLENDIKRGSGIKYKKTMKKRKY
ncbi:MAG: hypothetical protein K2P52_08500 [Campylobacterales bacterium]|jgi:hypothetical protein|nr:hypothetical protein [Campylobacterales bacterium]